MKQPRESNYSRKKRKAKEKGNEESVVMSGVWTGGGPCSLTIYYMKYWTGLRLGNFGHCEGPILTL